MWAAARARTLSARSKLRLLIVIFVAFALPAAAELGGNISSIQADQEHMKGTRSVTSNAAYSVHEIQAVTGTRVREFVSPGGTVFGVAWQGPGTPDLKQLLGTYFEQYQQAIQTKRAGRGPVSIRQSGLVVEAGGHMRWFAGRAYVPQMVPEGVDLGVIK